MLILSLSLSGPAGSRLLQVRVLAPTILPGPPLPPTPGCPQSPRLELSLCPDLTLTHTRTHPHPLSFTKMMEITISLFFFFSFFFFLYQAVKKKKKKHPKKRNHKKKKQPNKKTFCCVLSEQSARSPSNSFLFVCFPETREFSSYLWQHFITTLI